MAQFGKPNTRQPVPAAIFRTLIDPSSAARLTHGVFLDCRARLGAPNWGYEQYSMSHIPGAQHLDLDKDLAGPPGAAGRHPLPDREALTTKLRSLGVTDDRQIVVYDEGPGAMAARAWWLLRWLGIEAVAVLDGGWAAWQAAQLPEHTTQPAAQPGTLTGGQPLTRWVSVARVAAGEFDHLLDARSEARFAGREEPIDHKAGHIPGASCLPFNGNLTADGRFKSPTALAERFAGLAGEVVCYCGSGVTAAHNILAMRHAGLPEPALYIGSWSEWIEDPTRPIATDA